MNLSVPRALVLFSASILPAAPALAEVVTADIVVKSVDEKGRSLSVTTVEGAKVLELDVGKKAAITIDGERAALKDLKAGSRGRLEYDDALEAVSVLEISTKEPGAGAAGRVNLFNGNDLEGWKFVVAPGAKAGPLTVLDCWGVDAKRGVLFATGKGPTWLASEAAYDNFVLTLEWRFVPKAPLSANGSGVVVRAAGVHSLQFDPRGIEIDLSEKMTGAFMAYGSPVANAKGKAAGETTQRLDSVAAAPLKKIGEWNRTEIRCDGDAITVTVNGEQVNAGTGARVKKGEVCLRSQSSAVEFRKVVLTPIEAAAKE